MYLFISHANKFYCRTFKLRGFLYLSVIIIIVIIIFIIRFFHGRPLLLPLFLLYVSICKEKNQKDFSVSTFI
jgi:hypothetical protein